MTVIPRFFFVLKLAGLEGDVWEICNKCVSLRYGVRFAGRKPGNDFIRQRHIAIVPGTEIANFYFPAGQSVKYAHIPTIIIDRVDCILSSQIAGRGAVVLPYLSGWMFGDTWYSRT